MESKAFFDALQLNKHCSARLLHEERQLEQQQRKMYNRVWREKEILMDDYIHINVRTPSPQRTPNPLPTAARAISSSAQASRDRRHAAGSVSSPGRKGLSLSARSSRPSGKKNCLSRQNSFSGVHSRSGNITHQLSERVTCFAREEDLKTDSLGKTKSSDTNGLGTGESSNPGHFGSSESSTANPNLNPRTSESSSLAKELVSVDEVDAEQNNPQHVVSSDRRSSERDVVAGFNAGAHVLAGERQSQTQKKDQQKTASQNEDMSVKKTFKLWSLEHKRQERRPKHRALSASRVTSYASDRGQERSNTEAWSLSENQARAGVENGNLYGSGPIRPHTSSSALILGNAKQLAFAVQERPQSQQSYVRTTNTISKDKRRFLHQSSTTSPFAISSDPTVRASDLDRRDGVLPSMIPHENDNSEYNNVLQNDKTSRDLNNSNPTYNHEHSDLRENSLSLPNSAKEMTLSEHQTDLSKPSPFSPPPPHSRKKAHVRQMTLDPKLVVPLSSKRYQCKKQATIIPVIAVQGQIATLYPNAEAKAGRVVKLERRVRGWIERSNSILFCLESIHSAKVLTSSTVMPQREEHHRHPDEVVPSSAMTSHPVMTSSLMMTPPSAIVPSSEMTSPSPQNDVTTTHTSSTKHAKRSASNRNHRHKKVTYTRTPSSKTALQSQLLSSSGIDNGDDGDDDNDDDGDSDVVLVPQTIHRDPSESPALLQKVAAPSSRARATMQRRQQSLHTSGPGATTGVLGRSRRRQGLAGLQQPFLIH